MGPLPKRGSGGRPFLKKKPRFGTRLRYQQELFPWRQQLLSFHFPPPLLPPFLSPLPPFLSPLPFPHLVRCTILRMPSTPEVRSPCLKFTWLPTRNSAAFPQIESPPTPTSPSRTAGPSTPRNSLAITALSQPALNSSPLQEGPRQVLVSVTLCRVQAHNGTYMPVFPASDL